MAKYLIQASYTPDGLKGVVKDGGTGRREAVTAAVKTAGGRVEAFYYAFGDADVIVLVDAPDNVSVAAFALAVGSAGLVSHFKTTPLLTPEEIDQAANKQIDYRAPGR
jgi:uncharacterized protein with GYD domain